MARKNEEPKPRAGYYLRKDGLYEKVVRIDGKRVAFRSKDWREIDKKMLAYKKEVNEGPFFKEIAEEWMEQHFPTLAPNTLRGYKAAYNRILHEFGKKRIRLITTSNINGFLQDLASFLYGQKTVTNHLLVIRLIFDYACAHDILENNPAGNAKVPKGLAKTTRRFPSDAELKAVKEGVNATFGLFPFFILYTGCRRGEALALRWGDIDFENKEITINKSLYYNPRPAIKAPKSDKGIRTIILLDRLSDVLEPLKGKPEELVFHKNGKYMENMKVQRLLDQYNVETGTQVKPHELRHGFATMLFEAGVDAKSTQYFLGHAQISTTMDIYTHLREQRKRQVADMLNEYDKTQ